MAKRKSAPPTRAFVGSLFKRLAHEIEATVLVEPTWKTVGQIRFKNGKKSYFRYSSVDLNTLGASEISKDKDYASFFLHSMGYPVVPGKSFYSPNWAKAIGSKRDTKAALEYARKLSWPVMVKPNSSSQGKGVTLIYSAAELRVALKDIFRYDDVALVQKPLKGRDYRVVVLDDEVISAYERLPLSVTGDGRSSIKALLEKRQQEFVRSGRDTKIKFNDPRIKNKLKLQGRTLNFVPKTGEKVQLLDNANLSTGGDAIDVTETMHKDWKRLAADITKDMGLRICGVDLMIEGSIENVPKRYWVLETNAAPGLDHYLQTGAKQKAIVENMYRKVLRSLAR
jgi:D-alanine-D-alanine ligase-like ATP-grasp enzyme